VRSFAGMFLFPAVTCPRAFYLPSGARLALLLPALTAYVPSRNFVSIKSLLIARKRHNFCCYLPMAYFARNYYVIRRFLAMLSISGLDASWVLCVWILVAAALPSVGARVDELRDRTAFVSRELIQCGAAALRHASLNLVLCCGHGLSYLRYFNEWMTRMTVSCCRRHKALSRRLVEAMLPREVTDSMRAGACVVCLRCALHDCHS
jgi:hypothetical protein